MDGIFLYCYFIGSTLGCTNQIFTSHVVPYHLTGKIIFNILVTGHKDVCFNAQTDVGDFENTLYLTWCVTPHEDSHTCLHSSLIIILFFDCMLSKPVLFNPYCCVPLSQTENWHVPVGIWFHLLEKSLRKHSEVLQCSFAWYCNPMGGISF